MSFAFFCLILLGVFLNAAAQLLLKKGVTNITAWTWDVVVPLLYNFYILAGLACYVISVVVWLIVLSRTAVSVAYPLLSVGYIVTALVAHFFLGEALPLMRWVGIGVIMIGVYLVSKSA